MELKLIIYKDRLCRVVHKEATAKAFDLSTGVCEDVLQMINIDMFEGGLEALSDGSKQELMLGIVKNAYPFFLELVKEIFELTDEDIRLVKVADVVQTVLQIVKYSINQLASSFGSKNSKN